MIPDLQVETARVMDELFSPHPVADSRELALAIGPSDVPELHSPNWKPFKSERGAAVTAAVTHDLRPKKGTSGIGRCEFERVEASAGFEPAVEVLQPVRPCIPDADLSSSRIRFVATPYDGRRPSTTSKWW